MKTVRGKTWGVPRGKQYVRGWINPYRPILEAEREAQEHSNIECLFYDDLENETPEQFILRQEEATLLYSAIDRLHPREERVIRLRYMEGLTLDQVGEQFGVTRERIRQMSCKAERKLRRYLRPKFKDRYKALAKREGWPNEAEPTPQEKADARWAERSAATDAAWQKVADLEEQRLEAERLANLKAAELSRLEVERIRAENARRRPSQYRFYRPRLVDPATGAWEWVLMEYADDADAA